MGIRGVVGEVVPCIVMVTVEFCTIVLTILASTVISRGMSPFVFVVYTNALGSILLLLYSTFVDRDKTEMPLFTFHHFLRVFLLGLIGISIAQNLAFLGLSYSSPIVACGMGNLIPAFSFILDISLRRMKIDWKSSGGQVKLIGTLISMAGAISLTLYRGPLVKNSPFSSFSLQLPSPGLFVFSSTNQNWILGCILYAAASLALSLWNIVQVGAMKRYPQVMKIVCLYSLAGTILSAIPTILIERDPSAWRLKLDMELLVIVLAAIFGSIIRSRVQIWCMQLKGPLFASIFKPVGIPVASMFGCFLFAESFHYGSMMGAFVCGLGYYTLIWGQITDDEMGKQTSGLSPSDEKVPLLKDESQV